MKAIITGLFIFSLVTAAFKGQMQGVSDAILTRSADAVSLAIGLCGSLCLWSGVMEAARGAGLTEALAKLASPLLGRLFPRARHDREAFGLIALNFSANLLGLGNAATPFGLAAIKKLQEDNPQPERATDEMITLVILNSCSIQLIPTTAAAMRLQAGSSDPMGILGPTLAASALSLAGALCLSHILRKLDKGR